VRVQLDVPDTSDAAAAVVVGTDAVDMLVAVVLNR